MLKKADFTLTFLFHSLIFVILFLITKDNFFFWDKDIVDSIQAHWLMENNFNYRLPDAIDPGHPPLIPTVLALLWSLFGRELIVGHVFMLLVTLGALWQILKFLHYFIEGNYLFLASLIVLLDTTFMSQSVLISSDLVLVFFFFLSINSVLKNQKGWLITGLTGLCIISMRGLMSGAVVLLFHLYNYHYNNKRINLKTLLKLSALYTIPLILPILYYTWHYQQKGWIGYHADSPWASSYSPAGASEFIKNIFIVGWRLVDFGRIFLWLFAITLFLIKGKTILKKKNPAILLIVLFIISLIIYGSPMLIYEHISGHRYLLPTFLIFATLTAYLLFNYLKKYTSLIYILLLGGLLSGNLWIYPEKISQGWDSTLAHLPYYELKKQFLTYLSNENIKIEEVGAVTPNKSPLKYVHLNENKSAFAPLDLKKNKYIFYSNIMNEYTDYEIKLFYNDWKLEKTFMKNNIFIKLFKNPKFE